MNEQGVSADVMTTYYVIPLKGDTNAPPAVDYYVEQGKKWIPVPDKVLDSSPYTVRTDFVRLVQPGFRQMQDHGIDTGTVDGSLTLFAGVAKTLQGDFGVPNLFQVSDGALVVPVARHTSRGVILIFTKRNEAGATVDLVASSDPVIKNGPADFPATWR